MPAWARCPATAAEVLDEEVRQVLCPDKLTVAQWLEVMETAHEVGFRTTATIMFGHVDQPLHWGPPSVAPAGLAETDGRFYGTCTRCPLCIWRRQSI